MATCRSCGAGVQWVLLDGGSKNPLDPEPVENGNVYVRRDGTAKVLTADELGRARAEGHPLHISHFATCPNANKHRRR
ncbi:MAG: hypothetical protein AB7G37_03385 [Solirubrobacteraceae bacterium]